MRGELEHLLSDHQVQQKLLFCSLEPRFPSNVTHISFENSRSRRVHKAACQRGLSMGRGLGFNLKSMGNWQGNSYHLVHLSPSLIPRTRSQVKQLDLVMHTCNPSTEGDGNRRIPGAEGSVITLTNQCGMALESYCLKNSQGR